MSTAIVWRRIQVCLVLLLALGGAAPLAWGQGQPQPQPEILPDEKDFEGLTSLSLGSSARAYGMGGAFLARPDDATAASWNPAGLSYLRRPELSLVGVRNSFDRRATRDPFLSTDHLLGNTPDFAALTYPVSFGSVTGAVQVSFQRVFAFQGRRDIHIEDPETFRRFDLISEGHGGFDVLALATGLQLTRSLRVGVTVNDWIDGYKQTRTKSFDPELSRRQQVQEINYDLSGLNANLGLIWSPFESLNVGLVAKTAFTGQVVVHRHRIDADLLMGTFFGDRREERDNAELHLPGAVGGGLSWRVTSPLTVSADYTRTSWSEGEIRRFFLIPPPTPQFDTNPPIREFERLPYPSLAENQLQSDTEQLRLGAEFLVLRGAVRWPVRAGFFTDRQFFTDGAGRAPRYTGFTVGTGLGLGPVLLDVAYLRENGHYVDADARSISTGFHRVFVSVIYRSQ